MLQLLQHLLTTYGYLAVALGVLLESMGVPLPGETLLLLGAVYAGTGKLSVWGIIVAAAVGAIVGDSIGYQIGKHGGRALLERYGKALHINAQHLERAEAFFSRYGDKTVFFGRFIAVLRTFSAFLAGVNRMPYQRFLLYNAAGGIVWAVTFGLLGAAFGSQWPLIAHWAGRAGLLIVGILILVGLAIVVWRWAVRHEAALRTRWATFVNHPRMIALRHRFAPQLAFLQARLSPEGYLGLHLTIGLALIVAASWLFGGITEDIIHHDPLVDVDVAVSQFLAAHTEPPFTTAMYVVSIAGSPVTVLLLSLILVLYFAWHRAWRFVVLFIVGVGGAELLDFLLKIIFARPRPTLPNPLLVLTSYSFPSGHAMGSMAFYALLAYLVIQRVTIWRWRVAVAVAIVFLILLIGFSRMYLGVHYLSDVLAGYAAGFAWLVITITGVETIVRRQRALSQADQVPAPPSAPQDISR
jgi:membrane protein DedA with SNARE-associated domain/membrane-associated phospholipid phosphatase